MVAFTKRILSFISENHGRLRQAYLPANTFVFIIMKYDCVRFLSPPHGALRGAAGLGAAATPRKRFGLRSEHERVDHHRRKCTSEVVYRLPLMESSVKLSIVNP